MYVLFLQRSEFTFEHIIYRVLMHCFLVTEFFIYFYIMKYH